MQPLYRSGRDPHSKFSLDVKTENVTHIPEGYEKAMMYIIEDFLGISGQTSQSGPKWLGNTKKGSWVGL